MKRLFLILLPFMALLFVSCENRSVSTPGLQISSYLLRISPDGVRDTIGIRDTVNVADTVLLGMAAFGNFNYLTGIKLQSDTTKLQVGFRWNHKDDEYLAEGSDPEHGILLFHPEQINYCRTTVQYIPRDSGDHRIGIMLSSDAGEGYSPRTFYFDVFVK